MNVDHGDALLFLSALLSAGIAEEERLIICGFPGDPNTVGPRAWRPRPWRPGRDLPLNDNDNGYVTVASFSRAGDGSFRRRNETFCAGRALMVDDVGTKVKIERLLNETTGLPLLMPSATIETSPGNFQWWYFLREPERDAVLFDGLIRAFIMGRLLGADPGMSGVTRVGRLPTYLNAKEKLRNKTSRPLGFRVRLESLDADRRYTTQELLDAFGLEINGRREMRPKLTLPEAIERNRAFTGVYKFLHTRKMLKRADPDPSGWTEMHCPWRGEHSTGADTGAAIREPAEENDWYGAFRCHHGHCADRGWRDLTDWMNDLAAEELENAARSSTGAEVTTSGVDET